MTFYHQQVLKMKNDLYPHESAVQQVMNAKLFIDGNFANRININHVAGQAFYSKFHFIRIFRNCYGTTPNQYLREVRIQNAKKMMEKGVKMKDACYGVGFDSIPSFSGLFKKLTGQSPAVFIAAQNSKKSQF